MYEEQIVKVAKLEEVDLAAVKSLSKDEITVDILEKVSHNCYAYKLLAADLDKEKKIANAKKAESQELLGHLMDVLEVTSYRSNSGLITKSEMPNYRLPQDDASRAAFFQYLKDKEIFDTMITINSKTLQSFIKQEVALAVSEDPINNINFLPAGIEETEYRTTYSLRK